MVMFTYRSSGCNSRGESHFALFHSSNTHVIGMGNRNDQTSRYFIPVISLNYCF